MSTTANHLSPNDSANPLTITTKEHAMNNTVTSDESAVAGSSVSTTQPSPTVPAEEVAKTATASSDPESVAPSASKRAAKSSRKEVKTEVVVAGTAPAPTDPAGKKAAGKRKPRAKKFDPSASLDAAQKMLDAATGQSGALVSVAVAAVASLMDLLVVARSNLDQIRRDVTLAETALSPHVNQLNVLLTPILASLRKSGPLGREVAQQCVTRDPLKTTAALLKRLAGGTLDVLPVLVVELSKASEQAQPAALALGHLQTRQVTAEAHYNEARHRLDAAVMLLRARISGDEAERKWSALIPAEAVPPAPPRKGEKKHH